MESSGHGSSSFHIPPTRGRVGGKKENAAFCAASGCCAGWCPASMDQYFSRGRMHQVSAARLPRPAGWMVRHPRAAVSTARVSDIVLLWLACQHEVQSRSLSLLPAQIAAFRKTAVSARLGMLPSQARLRLRFDAHQAAWPGVDTAWNPAAKLQGQPPIGAAVSGDEGDWEIGGKMTGCSCAVVKRSRQKLQLACLCILSCPALLRTTPNYPPSRPRRRTGLLGGKKEKSGSRRASTDCTATGVVGELASRGVSGRSRSPLSHLTSYFWRDSHVRTQGGVVVLTRIIGSTFVMELEKPGKTTDI